MVLEFTGSVASGGDTNGSYAAWMNQIETPFNTTGAGYTAFPNPLGLTLATANPIGWSQLIAIYGNYRVYGSKIAITFTPNAQADTIQVTLIPSYSNISSVSQAELMQQPFAKNAMISSSRGSGRPLTNFITQHKLAGVRRQAIEDDLSGKFSANGTGAGPTVVAVWNVLWETPNGAMLNQPLDYTVKMTYFVEFWEQAVGSFEN